MYLSTVFIVHTGLYRVWLTGRDEWNSQSLMRKTEEKVRRMKEEVRKQKRQRAAKRRAAEAQEEHDEGRPDRRKPWKRGRKKKKSQDELNSEPRLNGSPLAQTSSTTAHGTEASRNTANPLTAEQTPVLMASGTNRVSSQRRTVQDAIEMQPMSNTRLRGGEKSRHNVFRNQRRQREEGAGDLV